MKLVPNMLPKLSVTKNDLLVLFRITLRSPAVYAMAAYVQNSEERASTQADSAYTVGVERLVRFAVAMMQFLTR